MRPGKFKPYYLYRFLRWKLGDRSPLTAVAKITNKCDLQCDHCPWWKRDIEEYTTEEWCNALEKARKKGVIHLILEGGEPTQRGDVDRLISHAKELGMLVMMITNGVSDLSNHDPDSYWISVEGIGETHDENRGEGVFDKLVVNLKNNPQVNRIVGVTINKRNFREVEKIASFFSPICDGVWFNFMYPYQDSKDIALSLPQQKKVADEIINLKSRYNIISSYSYLRSIGKKKYKKNCPSFLTLLVDVDTSMHQGCTVELIEECRCHLCNLGCYGELAQAMRLKKDSIDFLKKTAGFKSDKLLWLK